MHISLKILFLKIFVKMLLIFLKFQVLRLFNSLTSKSHKDLNASLSQSTSIFLKFVFFWLLSPFFVFISKDSIFKIEFPYMFYFNYYGFKLFSKF